LHPIVLLPGLALLVAASFRDVRSRRIPNGLCAALAAFGLLRLGLGLAVWRDAPLAVVAADLAASLALLLAGAGLFAAGWLGGGDVKLLAAAGLWIGVAGLPGLLAVMSLTGGLLALGMIVERAVVGLRRAGAEHAATLPYGLAIAAGGIATATGLV
jgi:prepilin peptidase CpaA